MLRTPEYRLSPGRCSQPVYEKCYSYIHVKTLPSSSIGARRPARWGAGMMARALVPLLALAAPPVGSPTVFPGLGVTIAGCAAGWNTSNTRDGGWGQPQSWMNLTFGLHDFANSSAEGPWTLDTPHVSATVTRGARQQREWELSLTPKVQLHYISFPLLPNGTHLDGRDELFYLLPFQGGAFAKDGEDTASYYANVTRSWESPGLVYPGRLHAPYFLLCTTDECLMAASTNWASRLAVRPRRAMVGSPQKEAALDFMNGCLEGYNIFSCTNKDAFPANRTTHLSIILGVFESEPAQHFDAWQKAVVAYRDWLRPHLPAPIQPKAMLQSEGLAAVCLECISVFNLTMLQTRFEPWQKLGYRLQLWGQMSNSANQGAVPPLKPGEAHGCCLMEYKMHPRYADAGLPQWAKSLGAQGVEAGYYSQPLRPMVDNPDRNVSWGGMPINNTAWIVGWLDVLRNNYSANAFYIDVFGRVFEGSPAELLALFNRPSGSILPANSVTEGWVDFSPFGSLLSGYSMGWGFVRGVNKFNTEIYDLRPFSHNKTGTFINMIRLLQGDAIGYYGNEDGTQTIWGDSVKHFAERQVFLMGAKFDVNCLAAPSPYVLLVKEIRDRVKWWSRGMMYQDTMGVGNAHAKQIDVRRFDDRQGRTVLAVDNYHNVSGLSVEFGGVQHAVEAVPLSVIEVNASALRPRKLKTDDAPKAPVSLIIDTDLGSDVSNLISICGVNAMMDAGEVDLKAVVTSTGLPTAIGAVSAVNHFYGHDVPLGAYKGKLGADLAAGGYVADLIANFSSPVKNYSQVPEAHVLYRKVLAAQPDQSVVIAAHGFLMNLEHLLNSTADENSALNGTELVARKVKQIVIMAGQYPTSNPPGHEWNMGGGCSESVCAESSASSAYVASHLPASVPTVFSGFEVGSRIHTGTRLLTGQDCPSSIPANPCRRAFADYCAHTKKNWRESWDSVTTLFAVRGAQDFETLRRGHNVVNGHDGSDVWSSDPAGRDQSYMVLNETTGVGPLEKAIDDNICAKPRALKTTDGASARANCSQAGLCFNVSGAENGDPNLKGVDLNGLYYKTSHLCFGQPSWQQASGGPALYYFGPSMQWDIGPGDALTKGAHVGHEYCAAANFLYSGKGVCPAGPDGAGCAGKWMENHGSPDWQPNSRLKIAAVQFKSDEHDIAPSSARHLLGRAAPPGSSWHAQVASGSRRDMRAPVQSDSPKLPCPNETWAAAAQATTGMLSVKLFGAAGDGKHDDAPAVRAAMNASNLCGGGCIFFPPGEYHFDSTVVASATCWKGSAATGTPGACVGQCTGATTISGPSTGNGETPTIAIHSGDVYMQDIEVYGNYLGIYIANAAYVRFVNVGAQIEGASDSVDTSPGGCNRTNCNVVLGSLNAALVIENSFWLWFERCGFVMPISFHGQRPSVILRGQGHCNATGKCDTRISLPHVYNVSAHTQFPPEVYLVRFDQMIFTGGGVQYQQMVPLAAVMASAPGSFDFVSCVQEQSATPLLDVQSTTHIVPDGGDGYFPGLKMVVIRDYMDADWKAPAFGSADRSVVAMNCSLPKCTLDGFTISSAGFGTPVAVRVYSGDVTGTTILTADSNWLGGQPSALRVLDAAGRPVGSWRQTDGAGWLMSSAPSTPALSFLVEGEDKPRKVIHADGSTEYRRQDSATDEPTHSHGLLANETSWDPPHTGANGGVATTVVGLRGAASGDAVSVGLSSVDAMLHTVQITATAAPDFVKVVLQNLASDSADIGTGQLRVHVHKWSSVHKTDDAPNPTDVPPEFVGYGAVTTVNPLKELPPLQKSHYVCGAFDSYVYNSSFADGVVDDFARISGSVPLELGYSDFQSKPSMIFNAVRACHKATQNRTAEGLPPCELAINYDPWIWKFARAGTGSACAKGTLACSQRNPASTIGVQEELDFLKAQFDGYLSAIDAANKQLGSAVVVGAVIHDSEYFVWPGYPDANPTLKYWQDLAHKNQLIFNATVEALPKLPLDRISYYSRGNVAFRPDLNASACLRGRTADVQGLDLPPGHCMSTDAALDLGIGNAASPFSPILYAISEPELMRMKVVNTMDAAKKYGVKGGQVWPFIALGTGYRRYIKSMPSSPGRVPPVPVEIYKYHSEYLVPGEGLFDYGYDYPYAYSALMGAMVNDPQYERSNWGNWEQVTAGILYPSPFDDRGLKSPVTPGSTHALDHFVAYCRGAAGIA